VKYFEEKIINKINEMKIFEFETNFEIQNKEYPLLENDNYKITLSYQIGINEGDNSPSLLKYSTNLSFNDNNKLEFKTERTDFIRESIKNFIEELKIDSNIIKKEEYSIIKNEIIKDYLIEGTLTIINDLENNEIIFNFEFIFKKDKDNLKVYANLILKIKFKDRNKNMEIGNYFTNQKELINFKNEEKEIIVQFATILIVKNVNQGKIDTILKILGKELNEIKQILDNEFKEKRIQNPNDLTSKIIRLKEQLDQTEIASGLTPLTEIRKEKEIVIFFQFSPFSYFKNS
jgi:hypothetical protein